MKIQVVEGRLVEAPTAGATGIGAGNPGGGTFHAVAFVNEEGHAYSLVDERFEDVPEGGPGT